MVLKIKLQRCLNKIFGKRLFEQRIVLFDSIRFFNKNNSTLVHLNEQMTFLKNYFDYLLNKMIFCICYRIQIISIE